MAAEEYREIQDPRISPVFDVCAVAPQEVFHAGKATVCVYTNQTEMGTASAVALASRQCDLVESNGTTSIMIMTAPSAFPFYEAYVRLALLSPRLQAAIRQTHFFQFDDFVLPSHHPASFRFLLREHLFQPLASFCDPEKIHPLMLDASDPDLVCMHYARKLLSMGPDLQLKGVGENGHWGFHEPGMPLEGEPAFVKVELAPINIAQQVREHPELYTTIDKVPRVAYTANVPLFMKTRVLIEDNIPQGSKAFALLAAYGNDKVDVCCPSSKVKQHPHVVVRTTTQAAWALSDYRRRETVTREMLDRMSWDFRQTPAAREFMVETLHRMDIRCEV